MSDYRAFLEAKMAAAPRVGFDVDPGDVHPLLKPHQRDAVVWAVRGGRRALFEAFGLGKSVQQLEILRLTLARLGGGRALIVCPLGVRQEFRRDAAMLGAEVTFIRSEAEASADGIYLTNYETVRDGKLDPRNFQALSLDEAGVLRGFGGTKTFRELMRLFEGTATYRFVATATPSPNEFIELLAYAAFLDIMDVGQAKTRFFQRDSEHADRLTLRPPKAAEFWAWMASWALFLQRPSDLGYSDEGYELPPLDIRWHEIPSDHAAAGEERDGQGRLLHDAALGVQDAAREKRRSLPARMGKLLELRAEDHDAHRVIWHDLEDERRAIEQAVPGVVTVFGAQDLDDREDAIIAFSEGKIPELAAKPVMLGAGCNLQRHCAWAIFLGIGFKFNDFIQAVHRLDRFQQTRRVRIDLIYTEAEREVRRQLERKWRQHEQLVATMTEIIREHGMAGAAMAHALTRAIGCDREEIVGEGYRLVHADAIEETRTMPAESVGLIITSIPFSTQYEYSPSYNDFGHTDDNEHFWRQMDFLTPDLLRILQPGRMMVIHVKDRIAPGGLTGLGFQTVQPFHAEAIFHYVKHGFAYLGMKTVVTDVVRENNQTYRLGWTEQCKDGSRMGCGMPEYLLLFRKPPTDRSNGYADVPVVKAKREWRAAHWTNDGYSRARWQLDAHGFQRSNGDRLLAPADLVGLKAAVVYRTFRDHSRSTVYDYAHHVACGEVLEAASSLPPTFMLLPPASWHPDVWTDVARMRTLNTMQAAKGREQHLCPMPLDMVERLIAQLSMEGEVVFDPFMGLGTVPYCAVRLKRRGIGVELSAVYFQEAARYLKEAEAARAVPTLFDLIAAEEPDRDVGEALGR